MSEKLVTIGWGIVIALAFLPFVGMALFLMTMIALLLGWWSILFFACVAALVAISPKDVMPG